jgi:hypothetical protein|tara:strand:- start:36930 stop:37745 length:816 start_codon:yes stop_codon:yes gene_type:complete
MKLKSILNKINDTVRVILVQPTMVFRVLGDQSLKTLHYVDADEVARPDLIADKYYGDHTKVDIILKYNRISDPFSIKEGEILRIPVETIAYYKLERPNLNEAANAVKQQFIDTKRLNPKDQAKIDRLKKKYGKDELLPPNVVPTGKKTYDFVGGMLRMGKQSQTADVTDSSTLDNLNAEDLLDALDSAVGTGGDAGGQDYNVRYQDGFDDGFDEGLEQGITNAGGGSGDDSGTPGGGPADSTGDNSDDGTAPRGGSDNNNGDGDDDSPCAK